MIQKIIEGGVLRPKSKTKIYRAWGSMWARCKSNDGKLSPHYRSRGITVCDRWKDFNLFLEDVGPIPIPIEMFSLDRIDNGGIYEPSNCRWADSTTQIRNRRNARAPVTFGGKTKFIADWAKELGMPCGMLDKRINVYGWPIEKALTLPMGARSNCQKHPKENSTEIVSFSLNRNVFKDSELRRASLSLTRSAYIASLIQRDLDQASNQNVR